MNEHPALLSIQKTESELVFMLLRSHRMNFWAAHHEVWAFALFHPMAKSSRLQTAPWEHSERSGKQKVDSGVRETVLHSCSRPSGQKMSCLTPRGTSPYVSVYSEWFLGPPV